MSILFDKRRFGKRILGRGLEFCWQCKKTTKCSRTRYFPFLAVFFIPILPLGIRHKWVCEECGNDPQRISSPTMVALEIVALSLVFGLATFWLSGLRPREAAAAAK